MSNQLAEALRNLMQLALNGESVLFTAEYDRARDALAAHEAARERTGWPAEGRMAQDDSRELSKWLSNTPGARRLVDEAAKPVAEVHPSHLRPAEEGQHWCREVLLYSGGNPGDTLNGTTAHRVKLYAAPVPEAAKPAEPVAWMVLDEDGAPTHVTGDKQSAHEHIMDAISEHGIAEAVYWIVRPCFLAAPVAAASPWLPIESAPKKGGTKVLLFGSRSGRPFIDEWADYARFNHPRITHWMPLPPAPEMKP